VLWQGYGEKIGVTVVRSWKALRPGLFFPDLNILSVAFFGPEVAITAMKPESRHFQVF
jgi:hypothetical protein